MKSSFYITYIATFHSFENHSNFLHFDVHCFPLKRRLRHTFVRKVSDVEDKFFAITIDAHEHVKALLLSISSTYHEQHLRQYSFNKNYKAKL